VSADQSNVFVDAIVTFLSWFGFDLNQAAVGALSTIVRKVIGHFLIFMADGVFAYLTAFSFFRFRRGWMMLLVSALAMIFVASVSEIIQLFASGRAGTLVDVILDSAGAFLGIGVSAWIRSAHLKKKELAL
jgi:VanZ family protein